MEMKRSKPRIQRRWIRWPAPGMSQPTADAITGIMLAGSTAFVLAIVEFAIR
jgi:hypothetical protein